MSKRSLLVAGVISGASLVIAFYRPMLAWMAWIALVPWLRMLWSEQTRSWRQAALAGGVAGLFYYLGVLAPFLSVTWWGWGTVSGDQIGQSLNHQRQFMLIAWLIASVWGGLWWALWSVMVWMLRHRSAIVKLLVVPSLWLVWLEYTAYHTAFQLSWGWLGYLMAQAPITRQVASLAGVAGVSWLIVWVNTTIAIASRRTWRTVMVAVGVVVACQGYGLTQLLLSHRAPPDANRILRVALLQGNVTTYRPDDFTAGGLDKIYAPMMDQALKEPIDLMVLPESVWLASLSLDGTRSPVADPYLVDTTTFHNTMSQRLAGHETLLITGLDTVEHSQPHNSMLFWSKDGLRGAYHKRGLVPFAEYRPAWVGRFAPANQLHSVDFAYVPGDGPRIVTWKAHRLGSFICQEVLRPDLVRDTVRAGATVLITTGNDGVFLSPTVARVHLAAAQLRAIENRRWVLRSTKTGASALIDPWGRITAAAPMHERAIVQGRAADLTAITPYTMMGNRAIGVLCLLFVGVLGLPLLKSRLMTLRDSRLEPAVSTVTTRTGGAR